MTTFRIDLILIEYCAVTIDVIHFFQICPFICKYEWQTLSSTAQNSRFLNELVQGNPTRKVKQREEVEL